MSSNNIETLDIIDKAYIAGLLYKYKITNTFVNIRTIDLIQKIYPIYYFNNSNKIISIDITNNNGFIESINKIILDFPNFTEDVKLIFIRGIYEANNNRSIEITDNIKPIIDIIKNNYIINYDIISENTIINSIIYIRNKYKFYKKIYSANTDLSCLCQGLQKLYMYNTKNPKIKVFKTTEDAVIPSKAFEDDAGYDLTIISKIKDFNSKTSLYDTGIKIEVEEGYYTEIVPRSSISKSGYMLANSIGIIDNNYRGNLMIALTKICDDAADIELPFKCCQLIIRKQISADLVEVSSEDLTNTERNEGGFGSTSS